MTDTEFRWLRRFAVPFSRLQAALSKLTGGRILGKFQGLPVVLIEMTGAKSGQKRTIPLMYVPYKEGVIIVASQGGAPKSPVWHKNLLAHPEIVAQYKSKRMKLRARQVDDAEKAEVWPTCVEHYPEYAHLQERPDRNIPVFVCEPY